MSLLGAVAGGRAAALGLMVDACTIARGTDASVFDPDTGEYTSTPGQTLYTGPCRVKPRDNADRVVDAAGEPVTLLPYLVSVPIDTVQYEVDDRITVTAAALDPALVGLVLRVREPLAGSTLTARRLGCEVDAG